MFNIQNNLQKWWTGADQNIFNEGFDTLFQVDSSIVPEANSRQKKQLADMNLQTKTPVMKNNKLTSDNKPHLEAVQKRANNVNIVLKDPRAYEDAMLIVKELKERNTVIVNLQYLDNETSQRVIDFISGAAVALNGSYERVGSGVFVFAPINCNLNSTEHSEDVYKEIFGSRLSSSL